MTEKTPAPHKPLLGSASEAPLTQKQLSKLIRDACAKDRTESPSRQRASPSPSGGADVTDEISNKIDDSGNRCITATERQATKVVVSIAKSIKAFGKYVGKVSVYLYW